MWITQKESSTMAKPVIEVACAIITDGEKVLVVRRSSRMPHPLKWEFPGGKLRPGENPEGCIIREIREELGVVIATEQLYPSVKYAYDDYIVKLIPFVCRISQGNISLAEHTSYSWVDHSELEQLDLLEADGEVVELLNRYR
jgi:8-oxo-dGTP diphosphatase